MSVRNLEYLLQPRSVAVIGASERPGSVGATVVRNLIKSGFPGPIWPVCLKHDFVAGKPAFKAVAALPEAPDLAVICTPAHTVPSLIAQLGSRGSRAAIVLSAGLEAGGADGQPLVTSMLRAARPYLLRILGPNCVGLLVPSLGLNASFAHTDGLPGHLAFVTQSGALMTAMLDWARAQKIGFSRFISLGNAADVDFGDLLDYLADDSTTRAILLYIESISHSRKFMSAARAAARNKPVIVVKAGRVAEGARAAASHTGALAGADDVYDAAIRRAGMLRVDTTRELFDAAETLSRLKPLQGERLAIISNGGGPAVMATDALISHGGELAELSAATLERLDAVLPRIWSHGNPVDIIGDAPAQRYVDALHAVLEDPDAGAALLLHAPTSITDPASIARACVPALQSSTRPLLTCWMGGEAVAGAAALCAAANVPTYETPEDAVGAFLQAVHFQRNQRQLMEVPAAMPDGFEPDRQQAREIINAALATGRNMLSEPEAKGLLAAYRIAVAPTCVASDIGGLGAAAAGIGFPLVLKILSPDITHKSDVAGVALDIGSMQELEARARAMMEHVRERAPAARLEGFTVQSMVRRPQAFELIAGIAVDPTFGPVVLFGQGGTAVEVIADKAVALLPLNRSLAQDLIARTRVQRLLAGYRDRPAIDRQALELALVRLSQLAIDFEEILELDINPLLADSHGVLALDARVKVGPATGVGTRRLAIRPYPQELEERVELHGKPLLLRPIRPEDLPMHQEFLARIDAEDMRSRFFRAVRDLPHAELARFTQIDYERVMAFIAILRDADGKPQTLGVARAHSDPDEVTAEFAVLVRSDVKGQGLGALLLGKLIRYCRERGLRELTGEVLADNFAMLRLAAAFGFRAMPPQEGTVRIALDLQATATGKC